MSNKIKAREEEQSTELYNSYTFMYKRILETNFREIFSSGPDTPFTSRCFVRCVCIKGKGVNKFSAVANSFFTAILLEIANFDDK